MKLRRIICLLSILGSVIFSGNTCCAQLILTKDNKTCLYGYTDASGKWIVPAQYVYAEEFTVDKYAVVGNGDKKGLADTSGALVLPVEYDQISFMYYDNWYVLQKDTLYAVFSAYDTKIHYPDFPYPITSYHNNYVIFQHGIYQGLAVNEKIIVDSVFKINDYIFDRTVAIHYRSYNADSIRLYDTDKNRFITKDFYKQVYPQDTNRYAVQKDGRYGMIDKNGKVIIPFSYTAFYQKAFYRYNPLVLRRKNNKGYDVYSAQGKKLNRKPYTYIHESLINENIYIVGQKGKYGMLKPDGTTALACVYDSIMPADQTNQYFLLYSNKGIQVADNAGTVLNTGYYTNICYAKPLSDDESDYSYSLYNYKFISLLGDTAVVVLNLEDNTEYITGSDNGMESDIRLYANGKYGYLSADLNTMIPPVYDKIFPFKSDQYYTTIVQNERFGIMDRSGNITIEPQYPFIAINPFDESSFVFMSDDQLFGIKNNAGDILIPPVYSLISGYDPELDYCWVRSAEDTPLHLINGQEELKSPLDFGYPVLLSESGSVIARARKSDEDEYKYGVLDCATLHPLIPFRYEAIKAVNDSMYLCVAENTYADTIWSDLYIHTVRIDSVTGFGFLPNGIVAVERCYSWGYFRNGKWLIYPGKRPAGYTSDEHTIIGLDTEITLFDDYDYSEYESILQFDSAAVNKPLSKLLNNELLYRYTGNHKQSTGTLFNEEDETTLYESTPDLYSIEYVNDRLNMEEETYEESYYGYSSDNTSIDEYFAVIAHTASFAELRYHSENYYRSSYNITHDNKQYTLTADNKLKQLSLGDITNHLQYKTLLSALINTHLDTLEGIQLPCTDRDNSIDLATGYQFEKEGIAFYFYDERADNSYDYEEITVMLSYAELLPYFKKSVYLPELYRNSLNR